MPVEFKDYYAVLGVPRDAGEADIKKAFRRLARLYHPDIAKDKKAGEAKFKAINEAYEVLGDPAKRKRYDELGANWQDETARGGATPGPRAGRRAPGDGSSEFRFDGTGFSDFFEQFFGGGRRGAGDFPDWREESGFGGGPARGSARSRRSPPQAGEDIEGDLLVSLDEAMRGSTREIAVRFADPETGEASTKTYRARIPRGVRDGQAIRLAGAGHPGAAGGPPGDLFLRARFARHPDFRPEGADLHGDLDLAPWEAVLGAKVTVPTLDSRIALRIPPGTANGQTFRIRGHGLPTGAGDGRGDFFVAVRIQTPTETTEEERALWAQLSRSSKFKPRGAR